MAKPTQIDRDRATAALALSRLMLSRAAKKILPPQKLKRCRLNPDGTIRVVRDPATGQIMLDEIADT